MMKKLIAILMGVGMMAGVAQADLLASWVETNLGTVTNEVGTGVVVSDITLLGDAQNTANAGDTWGMNNLDVNGRGLQFSIVSIADGQWIENAVISGTVSGSATGPRQMDWWVNSAAVTGESIIRDSTTAVGFQNTLGTLNSGDTISLRVDADAGTVRSGTDEAVGSGGSFRIRTGGTGGSMELAGDVIPEPTTMGLLGLGVLALAAMRRRLVNR